MPRMAATFSRSVERWRKPLSKLNDWVPLDFLLAWIDIESDGRIGVTTHLGERGLFQVHPAEVPSLKLTDAQFQNLTKDSKLALRTGIKQAKLYAKYTKKYLAEVGSRWQGGDFWKMVKLHHAAFAMPRYTLLAFAREHGRGPDHWDELMAFALDAAEQGKDLIPDNKKLSQRLRALTVKTFRNANKVGGAIPSINSDEVRILQQLFPVLRTVV